MGAVGGTQLSRGARRLLDRLLFYGRKYGHIRVDQKRLGKALALSREPTGRVVPRNVSDRMVRAYLHELRRLVEVDQGGDGYPASYFFTAALPSGLASGLLPGCFRAESLVASLQSTPSTEVADKNFQAEIPLSSSRLEPIKTGFSQERVDDEKPARVTVPPRVTSAPFPQVSKLSPSKRESRREPHPDPEEEMKLRLQERHRPNWEDCLKFLRKDRLKFGLNWADVLARDDRHTTNPARLSNPIGYYRSLPRELVKESTAAVRESARVSMVPKESALCTKCNRSGMMADGQFCDCAMGRDLAKIARRKQTAVKMPAARAEAGQGEIVSNMQRVSAIQNQITALAVQKGF
jgi:hypothetical protein